MKAKNCILKIGFAIILATALLSGGCKGEEKKVDKKKSPTIIVAKLQGSVTQLYFKGSLSPLRNIPVLSPVDGTVVKLFFKYGDTVKKDQNIVAIDSAKLADDYRQAVTKYLQAKDTYENSIQSYIGTEALHKAGVISTDEYLTDKSQHETNVLNYYQSKYDLEKVLRKAEIDPETIEKLSIVDTQEVNKILQRRFSNITVTSPGDGVALFPVSTDSSGSDGKNGKLALGSQVKEGQLILSVGDLSGFSLTLQVSEININKMQTGLKAIVIGDAFPGITLHGSVTSVAKQANPGQGSSGEVSMFNFVVQVPDITADQLKVIRVGMTANVEIDIKEPPHILVPINAVFQKDGQSMVTIIDPKTKQTKDVPVLTGQTTLTDVVILNGVKSGDQVIVHD